MSASLTYLLGHAKPSALYEANAAVVPAICEAMQAADVHGVQRGQTLVVVGDVVGEHPEGLALQHSHTEPGRNSNLDM